MLQCDNEKAQGENRREFFPSVGRCMENSPRRLMWLRGEVDVYREGVVSGREHRVRRNRSRGVVHVRTEWTLL